MPPQIFIVSVETLLFPSMMSKKASTSKDAAFATNTKASRSKPQTNDQSSYLRESQVQKMSAQEYEKRQEEIMEAIQTGKFVYDVSGSAR